MSATSKQNETQTPPKAPYTYNPNYTIRVICCVLFIFLTEICLAHYIYRLINSEIRENYLPRHEVEDYVVKSVRGGLGREEIIRIVKDAMTPRRKRSLNNLEEPQDDSVVDFFHPNMRSELKAKDEMEMNKTGKGTAPGGDNWVWLTSYCRVTMASIQGYCTAATAYCPPSSPGPKGPVGLTGEKGDRGFPGIPGPIGPRGKQGSGGEKGEQGRPGLDGRDGVPGEPGFDGMPGRNGHDGIPGKDGLGGYPGRDGRNGTDGRPGLTGPQGPIGPQGIKGLTGPRGRPGKPGNHGTPGIPGINAWKTKVSGSTELLIPPSIAGNQRPPAVIMEGDNVTIHCAVTGIPKPTVEWVRVDGQPITRGPWQAISVSGDTINITLVSRVHMGVYQCIADNGVPPQVNQTFILDVHFTPLLTIPRERIGAAPNTTAVLECKIEAFPEPIRYWERERDGKLLESGDKYNIDTVRGINPYTVIMQLNISRINRNDYSKYYCVAKNERGLVKIGFTVYEVNPGLATPPQVFDSNTEKVAGALPPRRTTQEELCPPVHCAECLDPKETKCSESGVSLIDLIGKWEIRQFGNLTYPGLPNRTIDCVLYAVGKPVYHRFKNETNGSWMRDPTEKDEKYYATSDENHHKLLEYDNKSLFRKDSPSREYNLSSAFKGNAHVVYNGSFYYHSPDKLQIVKFYLKNESSSRKDITFVGNNPSNYLYTTGNNYIDFSVDDNGLWVIFGIPDSNNTGVMKLDANNLETQYSWNISLNHHKVGEMFVVCGVLYAVDSVTARDSRIRFALDLYKNTLLDVSLPFTNPFRNTTMVGYNHKNKELYTWDRGNQLTYPVRYHEIGYKVKDEHESMEHIQPARQTGIQVSPIREE